MATTDTDARQALAERLVRLLPTVDRVEIGGPADEVTICYRRAGATLWTDGDVFYAAGDGVYRRHALPGATGTAIWLRMAGLDATEILDAIGDDTDLGCLHATFDAATWLAAA